MTEQEVVKHLTAFAYMECENMPKQVAQALDIAKVAIKEAQQYRKIGTVEECREAVEKQRAKEPVEDRHHGIRYTEIYRCSVCGNSFSGRGFAKYCYHCGQKLDWGEEE